MTIPIESAASSEAAADAGSASQAPSRPIPSPRDAAPAWLSEYLQEYWNSHSDDAPVAAGVLVHHLLVEHQGLTGPYLDIRLDAAVAGWGAARSVREHLGLVRDRWDDAVSPILTTRRVVLGLALDPELGRPLLGTGALESIVRLWSPQDTQGSDLNLPPWDMLSDAGRLLAEGQPLLAGALGAPSEWNGAKPVDLPDAASALAFAPGGDRVAVLCGQDVWQVTRSGGLERLGVAPPGTRGLGWGRSGVLTLALGPSGELTMSDLTDGPPQLARTSVMDAALSGDGSRVWLLEGGRLNVLRVGDTEPQDLATASARVIAVDHAGVLGLADLPAGPALVSLEAGAAGMDAGTPAQPLPNSPATLLGYVPADPAGTSRVVAVGRVAGRFGRARPGQQGGVVVEVLPDTRVARLATGPGPVTALAAGPGGLLAVVAGNGLRVWSLGTAPVVEVRAQYAPDRASGPQDLLDADSDARGLAALITSTDLVPPLAVGLFGAWGSGKSFLLERITAFVETFTRAGRTGGYLEHVPVVTFNAWHYAETNLWAALVNDVLLAIRKECSPAWDADEKVRAAEQALADARLRVRRRLRTGLLAVAAVAVVVLAGVVLWRTGFVRWLWALGLVTAALGVADSMRKTAGWLKDVGPLFSAIGGVWGARRRLTRAQLGAALARQDQPSEVTEAEELGGTIRKLVEDPEYRDLLGLVTRTRQRFQSLDDAVRAARKDPGALAAARTGRRDDRRPRSVPAREGRVGARGRAPALRLRAVRRAARRRHALARAVAADPLPQAARSSPRRIAVRLPREDHPDSAAGVTP